MYRDTCLNLLNRGASQSGEPPQGAGSPSKPRDAEYCITPKAGPSGLTEQAASIGKPAEEDTTAQKLPTAKTKLSGALGGNLEKLRQGKVVLGA